MNRFIPPVLVLAIVVLLLLLAGCASADQPNTDEEKEVAKFNACIDGAEPQLTHQHISDCLRETWVIDPDTAGVAEEEEEEDL